MSDENEKKIFASNLKYYMSSYNKSQTDLINDLGINKSTISSWCSGQKMPRMGTIQKLADYFSIQKSNLVEEKKRENQNVKLIQTSFAELSPDFQDCALKQIEILLALQNIENKQEK